MQRLHAAEIFLSIRHDEEKTIPTIEELVDALEKELAWWKNPQRTKEDLYRYVDWGVVMTREDDNDVWCK